MTVASIPPSTVPPPDTMLFVVISHPRPERPSTVAGSRQDFWRWLQPKLDAGQALWAYPKVGRGVVTAFRVASHEELHALLNQWADMIPAEFDVIPVFEPDQAKAWLSQVQAGQDV